jgi:hypothetical protein
MAFPEKANRNVPERLPAQSKGREDGAGGKAASEAYNYLVQRGFEAHQAAAITDTVTRQSTGYEDIAVLTGRCRFRLASEFFACEERVVYGRFQNGRSLLSFVVKDDRVFTASGGEVRQPDSENYYLRVDTVVLKGSGLEGEDHGIEGECHLRLSREGTGFLDVKCDVYNRAKGSMYHFYLEDIRRVARKTF